MHSKPQKYKIRQHNFLTKFILCNRIFLFDYRDKINSFKELKNINIIQSLLSAQLY